MSLLTNYEGLRHQIERLVRENEELKKLVRLIRENHELKSAIKTQAGGLGISGFPGGLNEAMAAPAAHQGVFMPQSPAAASEPILEDVGIMSLAPLAEMLSNQQPSPLSSLLTGTGSITQSTPLTGILTGTLGSHLTGSMAVPPSGTLNSSLGLPSTAPLAPSSHLAGSIAVPPTGTLNSSLGLPSTSPLTPGSQLASSVAVPPTGTLTSSLGLPSTSPLTPRSHLPGSMAVPPVGTLSSSLVLPSTGTFTPSSPLAGHLAMSLNSTLLPSTTASIGINQNLVPTPMNNRVASEAPRVRPPEPLQGSAPGPQPSKAPFSTEHPRSNQDPEPQSMVFVGAPLQASSPITPNPMPAFLVTSDASSAAPPEQATPASVPKSTGGSPTVPPTTSIPTPQSATCQTLSSTTHGNNRTAHSPTRAHHSPTRPLTSQSPSRNPHSPPRASSSPASVPRVNDTSRKSILDLERKLAHRKTSKFPDICRESKQLAWERLVGEIAFQLDRRILSSIFPERVRLYGFTVSNIPEKIIQASLNPNDHKLDEELCQTLTQRYVCIMNRLQSLGYNGRVHPALTEQLVNAYGILRERPELAASEGGSYTVDFLQRVLVDTVHPSMLSDALLLLSCLSQLAHDDGKPMFIW
ncbi:speriolin [Erinaceus europaeus]|uniref:Speriolin n=1 Tax=Erinaceus europaeus TaxID=9365 RepID=A0ABM3XXR9_ERIEU|nr:speriolin [Erinaceus europaeus]